MSDYVDNHSLAQDFPQHVETIHKLKMNDAHFSRMMTDYEILDKKIVRAEQGLEHMSGLELDSLKMERVSMKDALADYLKNA